ncbi:unnamed protein product [Auanema sp. JU1783]|nr:unnamed protein product [Auanema sp. JU1783]
MSYYHYNDRHRHRHTEQLPRGGGGKKIPDRWLKYDAIGDNVTGTRFLPFKTPLHSHICKNSNLREKSFDIEILLQHARESGKSIGLVIDLTNTDKYYNSSDWSRNGIDYIKIRCPGHEVHEREDVVQHFNRIVDDYVRSHNDDSLIGVHCTHGLNRTGYLICRYLVEREKWSAQQAIDAFEYARGYPIERGQYKTKLAAVENRLAQTAARTEVMESDSVHVGATLQEKTLTEKTSQSKVKNQKDEDKTV